MEKRIKINDQVSIGPQPSEEEIKRLADDGFKSVINLRVQDEDDDQIPPHVEAMLVRDLGMEYVHIPISSQQILHDQVATFRQAIPNLNHPIYVHCSSGKRAAALTLMEEGIRKGWSGQTTLEQARAFGVDWDDPHLKQFVKDYVDKEHQKATV